MRMSLSYILTSSDGINAQKDDVKLQEIIPLVSIRDKTDFSIYENGSFWYGGIVPHLFRSGKISRTKFILRGGEL